MTVVHLHVIMSKKTGIIIEAKSWLFSDIYIRWNQTSIDYIILNGWIYTYIYKENTFLLGHMGLFSLKENMKLWTVIINTVMWAGEMAQPLKARLTTKNKYSNV